MTETEETPTVKEPEKAPNSHEEEFFEASATVPEEPAKAVAAESEDDGVDYTPLASDDAENERKYKEYKRLIKEIACQNEILDRMKAQIHELNCMKNPTKEQRTELKNLYGCLEIEMEKSNCLNQKAIQLQNFGSKRRYKEIDLVTTFDDEDLAPITHTCETMQVQTSKKARICCRDPNTFWRAPGGGSTSDNDLCTCPNCAGDDNNEDDHIVKEIMESLKNCAKGDREKKKSCINGRDSIDDIHDKLNHLERYMGKLKGEINCRKQNQQNNVSNGKQSDCSHKKPCPCQPRKPVCVPPCIPSKHMELKKLKDNYMHLLGEYTKKDREIKALTKKLKAAYGSDNSADCAEIELLTSRIDELKDEQVEFMCLMREQSFQLEDYRVKYLNAQQKVEEQCAIIDKLNMNNKRIQKQINLEIKEIRCKFQDKLRELQQFPRLLENEQLKVAKLCKEKEDLEGKLMVVCKELKCLKQKIGSNTGQEDCKPQLEKCQQELEQTKKTLEEVQRQRDLFCDQLKTNQEDIDCLRSESAKIIARLKERSEIVKKNLHEQINRLEKELAQCRATACLSVSDRECVIREMQGQLNTLSYSFDAAQKQIKTLRNHISYMSNENCFPTKC